MPTSLGSSLGYLPPPLSLEAPDPWDRVICLLRPNFLQEPHPVRLARAGPGPGTVY